MMESLTLQQLAAYEKTQAPILKKSNFSYSFSLLPKDERVAINSIYAFFSYIDDIVDSDSSTAIGVQQRKLKRLEWWEKEIDKLYQGQHRNTIISHFADVIHRFNLPKQYFLTLIDGCRRDLVQNRYETFEELKDYCYSVASVVGLSCIEIFGYKYEETKNYAINLGYALQLTNILRDLKADKDRGYIYIPKEDLDRFNYSEQDLINEVYNENFINLMEFQVQRARKYYHYARTCMRTDERFSLFAAEIMDRIYYRLLEKIELNQYDVFNNKIRVSNIHKLLLAFHTWVSIKLFVKRYDKLSD